MLLDGYNIKSLDLKWYREQLGLVNQEPALFATSIRANILYGKGDGTFEDIEKAAKASNAHGFISQLPKGYDTQVIVTLGLSCMHFLESSVIFAVVLPYLSFLTP